MRAMLMAIRDRRDKTKAIVVMAWTNMNHPVNWYSRERTETTKRCHVKNRQKFQLAFCDMIVTIRCLKENSFETSIMFSFSLHLFPHNDFTVDMISCLAYTIFAYSFCVVM
jgi:hypothetical protein